MTPEPTRLSLPRAADPGGAYWRFYDEVAAAQVTEWLPAERGVVLDLSGGGGRYAALAAARGHTVLHVTEAPSDAEEAGAAQVLVADTLRLDWLARGSLDAVLAESGALSAHLAAETTFEQARNALRPGGRLLMCVESLVLGLARLASQSRWAELADVPSADVVLVPNEDGTITRCFWPEHLQESLAQGGFEVEWVRPRTVLPRESVDEALAADPSTLRTLVRTELELAKERQGEAIGMHLVAAARRR
jgi:SAM-dependent methyltransferase